MKFDVLVISSHSQETATIKGMLDEEIFHCVIASTYRQALSALCWGAFDAIVCDEYLLDGSWKDIIGQIADLPQAPAVIVVATGIEDRDRDTAHELGAYEVIPKPVEAPVLLNALYGACSLACIGQLAAGAAAS
jgi:DNA-binding response OmpR family regulator